MKKNSPIYLFSFIFTLLTIILYRDFLYTYRMQIENFLPYYNYQNQILYYLTGDKKFDIEAPMNLRFLGLWFQYAIFKFVPCVQLTNINLVLNQDYICATFSNALMNYLSMTCFLSLLFVYTIKKLKFNLTIAFISLLLGYIFFNYLEAFTLDRISVFYLLLILYFLDNKNICIILILLSCLVNEKIIIIFGIYFFIKILFYKEKKYFLHFLSSIISFTIALSIFVFYSIILNNGYFGSDDPSGIYNTILSDGLVRLGNIFSYPKGITNALIPIVFATSSYVYLFFTRNKKNSIEILIPLILILIGMGGGTTNIGRYVMYSMPLWIPIMAVIIYQNIEKLINIKIEK